MTTGNIRDIIKTLTPTFSKYYVGKLDTKYEKGVCVYTLQTDKKQIMAVGGKSTTMTKNKKFSILIHWNKNYLETESIAQELYDSLTELKQLQVGEYFVNYIETLTSEPIDVHSDEQGVYERVIDINVFYN